MPHQKVIDLANLIEKNPACKFEIDNDYWCITVPNPAYNAGSDSDEETMEIASSGNNYWQTDWYSGCNNYGAGLAEVMIELLNRRGFKIEASAV